MSGKNHDTHTGPTPLSSTSSTSSTNSTAAGQGHTPLAGRAHIVNRDALQDEASAGPGSLDPKTLQPPKVPEARRWLAKRGIELEVPAGWKFLGVGNEGRSVCFVSDTDATAPGGGHAIELYQWPLPDDVVAESLLQSQEEQLEDAVALKRVQGWRRHVLGQVSGLLVTGWGPDTRDAPASEEDLFLATDGTGRRALSWRGVVERGDERFLLILALSSPIESFPDARPCYDALLDRAGVWR
jgi:hypothetical protein